MDDNTPNSDDQNNQNSSQNDGSQVGVGAYESGQPQITKKNNLVLIAGGLVAAVVLVYVVSSMFAEPPKESEINPVKDLKQDGATNVAIRDKEEEASGGGMAQPQAVTLAPPPPPIESPVYIPPPMVPPPMAQMPVGMEPSSASSTIPIPPLSSGRSVSEEVAPPPPPPPPVPPMPAISDIGKNVGKDPNDEASKKRIKSNMLILSGGGTDIASSTGATGKAGSAISGDRNSAFADNVLRATGAEKAVATGLSNLNMTIAQGKIVYAVLETGINTDLPGTLRAIVSRDTYAEAGRDVLIPKGSRLIGTYNTDVVGGQSRVMVVWTRMIRPDGVDIQIGSSAVDSLGRAGTKGDVDNKFAEIFSTALMTTAITVGAAVAAEAVLPTETGSTTTTPEGNQTSTTSPAQRAAGNAVTDFSEVGKQVVKKLIDIRPTITVDQGSIVNIFVNKDLVFPSSVAGGGLFIQ